MVKADELIYSTYGQDPLLRDLVEQFVVEVPNRLEALAAALERGDIEAVESGAHQLKGAAGGYGFHEVTPVALQLEQLARDGGAEADLQSALEELIDLGRSMRAGGAS